MPHLVSEYMCREIGGSPFKFKVERINSQPVDSRFIIERIIREVLHMRPQDRSPCSRTTLNDKADIVHHSVAVTVQVQIWAEQLSRIDIADDASQQLRLAHGNPHERVRLCITDGIRGTVRLEIPARHHILVRDYHTILYIVGINGVIM